MGTGWVGGGVIPVHPASCKAEVPDSEAGPGGPCRGLEWVVWDCSAPERYGPPLPAVGPASLSIPLSPGKCRLLANKGEI